MDHFEKLLNDVSKFGDFTECNCNVVARSAAHAIAKYKGDAGINPFVIVGGAGLGKTHLLNSMTSEIQITDPQKIILYQTAQKFVSNYCESIRGNFKYEFLNSFDSVDYIVIDDFQEICNKEQTQNALIQIFNSHLIQKKQLILAISSHLTVDQGFDKRLLSVINGGLTVSLEVPDFEDRLLLLRDKREQIDPTVSDEVLEFMAQKSVGDIRSLEGFLLSAWASSKLKKVPMDKKWVEDIYQKLFKIID